MCYWEIQEGAIPIDALVLRAPPAVIPESYLPPSAMLHGAKSKAKAVLGRGLGEGSTAFFGSMRLHLFPNINVFWQYSPDCQATPGMSGLKNVRFQSTKRNCSSRGIKRSRYARGIKRSSGLRGAQNGLPHPP